MDSLMPAPRHSTCSGACEGCKAYPKCPEEVYCDDLNCRYSCPDYSIPGWSCARESKISDMILSFTDDKDLPLCPYFEQRSAEEDKLSDIWEIIGIYDELAGAPVGSYGGVGMKSEWKVTTNIIDGKTVYGVYRIIDVGEVDHSGNREMAGEYISCREAAQSIAEVLNELSKDAQ